MLSAQKSAWFVPPGQLYDDRGATQCRDGLGEPVDDCDIVTDYGSPVVAGVPDELVQSTEDVRAALDTGSRQRLDNVGKPGLVFEKTNAAKVIYEMYSISHASCICKSVSHIAIKLKKQTTHANVLRYNDWNAIKYCKSETTKFRMHNYYHQIT